MKEETKKETVPISPDGCPCGRETRYWLKRDGVMLKSCNKYNVCPSYPELKKLYDEWRSRAVKAEHELETLRKILAPKQEKETV